MERFSRLNAWGGGVTGMAVGEEPQKAGMGRTAIVAVALVIGVVVGFAAGWTLVPRPPPASADLSGAELTPERRTALAAAYADQPFTGGQATPNHIWRILPTGDLDALHLDGATLDASTKILYVVVGVHVMDACDKDVLNLDGGFTHFHKKESLNWDAGHGGSPGLEGYWLKHIAVSEFDMPWGHVVPGVDPNFHPTTIDGC